MPDNRMFSQLVEEEQFRGAPAPAPPGSKEPLKHVTWNLTARQVEIVDRYFTMLYQSDTRATKGQIVGLAIEVLDRLLEGHPPESLSLEILDVYLRRQAGSNAVVQAAARAALQPKNHGT